MLFIISLFYFNYGFLTNDLVVHADEDSFSINIDSVNKSKNIFLHSATNDYFSELFRLNLINELDNSGEVFPFFNLKNFFNDSALAFRILDYKLSYFPFYSVTNSRVFYYYSSNGDMSYFNDFVQAEFSGSEPVVSFNSSLEPQLIIKGVLLINNEQAGFFSYPKSINNTASLTAKALIKRVNNS